MVEIVTALEARITRLTLLTDAHRARQQHRPTEAIMERLIAITAEVAAMEAEQ